MTYNILVVLFACILPDLCMPALRRPLHLLKGGKRQRSRRAHILALAGHSIIAQHYDSRQGPLDGDPEVDVLLELWSLGLITPKVLRDIAIAACLVAPRPQMKSLSTVHRYRDLSSKLSLGHNDIPKPMYVKINIWNESAKKTCHDYQGLPLLNVP